METNAELIARYIDGTVTQEERQRVREYLSSHQEEYEYVLYLMDRNLEDNYNGNLLDTYNQDEARSCSGFSMFSNTFDFNDFFVHGSPSKGFAPVGFMKHAAKHSPSFKGRPNPNKAIKSSETLTDRLDRMLDELTGIE